MAFIKEKVYAFIDTPIERKRSDHRLKSVESVTDARSWVLDEELRRQHFLNVVNRGLQTTGARAETRGERLLPPEGDGQEVRRPTVGVPQVPSPAVEPQAQKISVNTVEDLKLTNIIPDSLEFPEDVEPENDTSLHRVLRHTQDIEPINDTSLRRVPRHTQDIEPVNDVNVPRDSSLAQEPVYDTDVPSVPSRPEEEKPMVDITDVILTAASYPEDVAPVNLTDAGPITPGFSDIQPVNDTEVKQSAPKRHEEKPLPSNFDDFGGTRTPNIEDLNELEHRNKYLDGSKDYLRNIIADKENEIERLLYRINAMAEAGEDSNNAKLFQGKLKEKDEELQKTKQLLRNTENMLKNLQNLIESTGEDPSKQKEHMDKLMEGLQSDMHSDIEESDYSVRHFEDKLRKADEEIALLKKELDAANAQVAALLSGDENELNKIIDSLRQELENTKTAKDAENKDLKDMIAQKDEEIKNIKDKFNDLVKGTVNAPIDESTLKDKPYIPDHVSVDPEINRLNKEIDNKIIEINDMKNKLEDEKNKNDELQDKLNLLTAGDENDLKNKILALSSELEELKSTQTKETPESPKLESIHSSNELNAKINELQKLLDGAKEDKDKLRKDLQNEKEKLSKLISADDNDLKKMLAGLEEENKKLKEDKELDNKRLKLQQDELDQLKKSLEGPPDNKNALQEADERLKELERLLNNEKEENRNLKKDLENAKGDLIALVSADENGLQNMLANAEKEIKQLKDERDQLKDIQAKNNEAPAVSTDKYVTDSPQLIQELDKLKKENKDLKDEIEQLKGQISTNQKPFVTGKTKSETSTEEKNLGDIVEKNRELERENADLRNQIDSLNNNIRTLAPGRGPAGQVDLKNENDRLKYELKDETNTRKILADEVESLKRQNYKLDNELMKLLRVREGLSDKDPEALMNKIVQLEKDKMNLENELKSQPDQFQTELKNTIKMRNKIKNLKEELIKQADDPDGFIDELKNTINELEEENKKLGELNNNLKKSAKDDKDKCNEAISEKDKNIEKLQAEINHLKDESSGKQLKGDDRANKHDPDACDKEKSNLKGEIDKLKDKIASTTKDPKTNGKAISKADEEFENLTKENQKLKDELKDLKGKTDTYKNVEDEKLQLKKENDTLKDLVKSLEDKLSESKSKRDVKAEDNKLLNENAQLKSQLGDLNEQLKKIELSRDQDKLKSNALTTKLEDENKNLKEKVKELENKPSSSNQDVSKLIEDNDILKRDNAKLLKDLDNLKREIEGKSLPKDGSDYAKENNNLKDENNKLKEKIKVLEGEIANTKIKSPTGAFEIDALKKYEKENNDLKNEVKTLKDKIKSLEDEIRKIQAMSPKELNNELNDENNKLKEKIKTLDDEIKKLNGKSPDTDNRVKSKELDLNNINKLKDENEKLLKENKYLKGEMDKMKEMDSGFKVKTDGTKGKDVNIPNDVKEKIKKVEYENDALKSKLLDLEKSLKNAQKENLDCENDKKELLDLIKKAEEAGGLSDNELINMYKKDIAKLEDDKKKLKDDLLSNESELNKLRDTNNNLIKAVEDSKGLLKTTIQSPTKSKLPTQQETTTKQTHKTEEKADTKKDNVGGSEVDRHKIIPEINRLNKELDVKNALIKDLKNKLDDEIKKNNMLRDQLSQYKKSAKADHIPQQDIVKIKSPPVDNTVALSKKKNEEIRKDNKRQSLQVKDKYTPPSTKSELKELKKEKRVLPESIENMNSVGVVKEAKSPGKNKLNTFRDKNKKPATPDNKFDGSENVLYQKSHNESDGKSGSLEQSYSDELKNLKKMLNEAEQLIDFLKKENTRLKTENDDLRKNINALDDKGDAINKFMDDETKKLNKILQKAIRSGMKSLYMGELDYVHDALNKTMGEKKGQPRTNVRHTPEEYEFLIRRLQENISSLMTRLDTYREHSSQQDRKLTQYSYKVQQMSIDSGRHNIENQSLQVENKQLRDVVSYEKAKAKQLEDILKGVLDSCKCTKRYTLHQNYSRLWTSI